MARFEHPLQLFSMEYPDNWEVRYQEETGGVVFVHPGLDDASALSLSPMAVTGTEPALRDEVVQAAARVGVDLDPASLALDESGDTRCAYGEGLRTDLLSVGSRFRFWVLRHGPLALYASQLGPGADDATQRTDAETALATLQFPEIMPPTPVEFRARVLEIIGREYQRLRPSLNGEWALDLADESGEKIATVGLENIYRTSLLNAESVGAIIREYLDEVLSSAAGYEEESPYEEVRDRLLPMLKSEAWVRDMDSRMELATVPFAEGLFLCFVLDEPTRLAFVTSAMVEKWNVPLERVQGVAQDNLVAKSEDLQMVGLPGADGRPIALIVNTQDGYAATRLALPSLRETLAEELGDEFLVGMPNRDFLIAFSQRDPEMSANIIRQVQQDYHQMNHPITDRIYRVRADSIDPA